MNEDVVTGMEYWQGVALWRKTPLHEHKVLCATFVNDGNRCYGPEPTEVVPEVRERIENWKKQFIATFPEFAKAEWTEEPTQVF